MCKLVEARKFVSVIDCQKPCTVNFAVVSFGTFFFFYAHLTLLECAHHRLVFFRARISFGSSSSHCLEVRPRYSASFFSGPVFWVTVGFHIAVSLSPSFSDSYTGNTNVTRLTRLQGFGVGLYECFFCISCLSSLASLSLSSHEGFEEITPCFFLVAIA